MSILLFSIAAAATPGSDEEPVAAAVDSPSFSKRELRSDADAMSKSSLPDVIIGASKPSSSSYGSYGPPGSKVSIYNMSFVRGYDANSIDTTNLISSSILYPTVSDSYIIYNMQSMSYTAATKASKTKTSKVASKAAKAKATKVTKSKASYSYSMSYGCERSPCFDSNVPRFIIDGSKDIGDTLDDSGFTKRCGCDCYTVKDSGAVPPFVPWEGETDKQRFAYRKVTSKNFSIKSRTCGVKCYDEDGQPVSQFFVYGRVGLEVRESLDPLAMNTGRIIKQNICGRRNTTENFFGVSMAVLMFSVYG